MPDTAPAATAARALLGVLVRTLLKIAGTALVTRGLVDQGTVDGLMATLAETMVGALMVGGASVWSVFRVLFEHSRVYAYWRALQVRPLPATPPANA